MEVHHKISAENTNISRKAYVISLFTCGFLFAGAALSDLHVSITSTIQFFCILGLFAISWWRLRDLGLPGFLAVLTIIPVVNIPPILFLMAFQNRAQMVETLSFWKKFPVREKPHPEETPTTPDGSPPVSTTVQRARHYD